MHTRETLVAFDHYLAARSLRLDAVIVGGPAREKLFALCDRGIDLGDCIALAPTAGELTALEPWTAHQDANPDWPAHVRGILADLAQRLGHGV